LTYFTFPVCFRFQYIWCVILVCKA
jgi:hypothetical protein